MVEKIINTIAEELLIKPEDITPETSLIDDLGADSLDLIEIVMKLEDLYDIQIEDDELEKIVTVQDVIEYIKNKGLE